MSRYFPSSLNVAGRDCWVAGSDWEAVEKAGRLAEANARVTMAAASLKEEDKVRLLQKNVKIIEREFQLSDIQEQFFIVLSAKENPALCESVYKVCRDKKILLCAIDQPRFCDVVNASVFKKGQLTVTISTDGAAPGLSRKIRQGLEASLQDIPIDVYLDELAALRVELEKTEKNPEERRRKLLAAVEGFSFFAKMNIPEFNHLKSAKGGKE